jgi:hypothetical protein
VSKDISDEVRAESIVEVDMRGEVKI